MLLLFRLELKPFKMSAKISAHARKGGRIRTVVCKVTSTWGREEVEHLNLQMPEHNAIKATCHMLLWAPHLGGSQASLILV